MADRENQHQRQDRPTGTSGRPGGDMNTGIGGNNDGRRGDTAQPNRNRMNRDEDEDSPLGNRTTNR